LLVGCLCAQVFAGSPEKIAPGISLTAATANLQKCGFEVGPKFALARIPRNPNHNLEFCGLDDDVTLIIQYDESNGTITSLEIVIIPERAPKLHRREFSRKLFDLAVEDGGVYTLRIKRKTIPASNAE
jgi:hypothetical protein